MAASGGCPLTTISPLSVLAADTDAVPTRHLPALLPRTWSGLGLRVLGQCRLRRCAPVSVSIWRVVRPPDSSAPSEGAERQAARCGCGDAQTALLDTRFEASEYCRQAVGKAVVARRPSGG